MLVLMVATIRLYFIPVKSYIHNSLTSRCQSECNSAMKLTSKKLNFVTCTTDFESLLLTTGHGSQHVQQSSSYNDIADSADIIM